MKSRHCDDVARDDGTPDCVRHFLSHARAPAHGAYINAPTPSLFARHNGVLVRVVMASRFGDVGITENLESERGYSRRVLLDELTDFSSKLKEPNR